MQLPSGLQQFWYKLTSLQKISLISLALVLLALPAGLYLTGQSQEIRKKAAGGPCDNNGGIKSVKDTHCVNGRSWSNYICNDGSEEGGSPAGSCSEGCEVGSYERTCTGQRGPCDSNAGVAEIRKCGSATGGVTKWTNLPSECRTECAVGGTQPSPSASPQPGGSPPPQGSTSCTANYALTPSAPASPNSQIAVHVTASSPDVACVVLYQDGVLQSCKISPSGGYDCTVNSGSAGTRTLQLKFGQGDKYPAGTSCGQAVSCNSITYQTSSLPTPTPIPTPSPTPRATIPPGEIIIKTTQTLNLNKGYNLIGINVDKGNYKAADLLKDLNSSFTGGSGKVTYIFRYNVDAKAWETYTTTGKVTTTNFSVVPWEAYIIYSRASGTAKISGGGVSLPDSVRIPAGWSLWSASTTLTDIPDAKTLLAKSKEQGVDLKSIWKWDAGAKQYVGHKAGSSENNFSLVPGEGYWIYNGGPTKDFSLNFIPLPPIPGN